MPKEIASRLFRSLAMTPDSLSVYYDTLQLVACRFSLSDILNERK
jgi:hypothetical protein